MKLKFSRCLDIEGEIKAPSSKSYTHRAIILASLAEGCSQLFNPLLSEDTLSTLNACITLGADITNYGTYIDVNGMNGEVKPNFNPQPFITNPDHIINLGNSGTSLRLLTSIAALSDTKVVFTGDDSLKTRPMGDLLKALKSLGVETNSNNDKAPITVYPGFKGGSTSISGNISSQFISSLLISAPLTENGIELEVLPTFVSKPYVDMTIDIMSKFGVNVDVSTEGKNTKFIVKPQKYTGCDYIIEGDYSSSSYLLAACAIFGGEIKVLNLFKDSKQGDKIILDILDKMGADIKCDDSSVILKSQGNLKAISEIDLSNAPDLLPTITILSAIAEGTTKIVGIGHTRFKETDRIATTCEELKKCGCELEEFEDYIIIKGQTLNTDEEIIVSSHKDHRLAMAFILLNLKGYNVIVDDGDVFNVSFPEFMDAMGSIGVNLELTY
ncbi:3-phosphoshikimate 1-carboxyvinyltransferase [Methanobrevibacter sp. 87.7]|uniref:3-phosphoshikimate 1-carboxyvinyltransferase n=1 Tax=Methanobrevibacter sp. 87.7 TaxID=387957 RepID=UPI000B50410B|nr:3-phosphoshikimate 1-carboxyvinyltransferase [Methanobrevibacter sp. 87.7]OWT32718.1 3-phosphoshikimate 1-carboxyvinyltransferase [Methanobrevibacter sp. 87.7]